VHDPAHRLLLAALAAAVISTWTAPACADDTEEVLLGVGIAVLAAGDLTFSVRDIVAVARDEHPGFAWSLSETLITGPQTIAFGVATAVLSADRSEEDATLASLLMAPGASWLGTLTAHGLWGAMDPGAAPGGLFGASPLIGGNFSLTLVAVGNAAAGRLPPIGPAAIETLGATPGAIVGGYYIAKDEDHRGLWIGLTAWSGTLFVHGLISCIAGAIHDDDDADEDAPLPPEPPPPPPPEKPTMIKAARWTVVPTTMQDAAGQRVPAISVAGQLW